MPDSSTIADVVFNIPLWQHFSYTVPDTLASQIHPGVLVSVRFQHKLRVGCVTALRKCATADSHDLLPVEDIASPGYALSPQLLELGEFISEYYVCPPGEVCSAMALTGFRDVRVTELPRYLLVHDWNERKASLTPRQQQAAQALADSGNTPGTRAALATAATVSASVIGKLVDSGILAPFEDDKAPPETTPRESPHELSEEQDTALKAILERVGTHESKSRFGVFLLHGVTGSGKTEVYLQAIASTLRKGCSVICLVPEISLTPQTVHRFEERIGGEIGVFHSQMTRRAKLQLHDKIARGSVRVVIGARSAIFAPLPDIGLIVVDEEHDGSYKQGEAPRYHARDVAIMRARRNDIPVVLGSATPSLESYTNALEGKYTLLHLSERAASVAMPDVRVIDLATEVSSDTTSSNITAPLRKAIAARLERGEQSLLFLNRRGFSNFLFCPSCRWVARCDEDDVALTVHRRRKGGNEDGPELDLFTVNEPGRTDLSLRCHFCGKREPHPGKCPACGREDLITVGSGTQRIEDELRTLWPDARILRLDYDTTSGRDAWLRAWNDMVSGNADIIVGTQMVAKGLHLEKVTLVGIILADVGLFIPDFRADERTFSLLTQVAGRAGRISSGEVLLQTWMPRHTAVRCATRHDYEGFYKDEIRRRRQLGFPPFSRITAVTVSDPDRDRAWKSAGLIAHLLRQARRRTSGTLIINGPALAPIARLGGRHRYRILLRSPAQRTGSRVMRTVFDDPDYTIPASTRVAVDVDPVDLL